MKNKMKITATLLSLAILATLIAPLMLTTVAFAEGEVISVGSAEELIDFAKSAHTMPSRRERRLCFRQIYRLRVWILSP